MPIKFIGEDDNTFTIDSGAGPQQVAKTPDMMAPGGIYEQAKSLGAQPQDQAAPAPGFAAPPPPQAPVQLAQDWTGSTGTMQPQFVGPPASAAPTPDPTPAAMPQMQQQPTLPMTVPITQTTTETKGAVYDPTRMAALQGDYNQVGQAEIDKGNINAAAADQQAKLIDQKTKVHQDQQTDAQQQVQNIAKIRESFMQTMPGLIQDYVNAGVKPKPIFEDGKTGQNIAAGIAIMFGALGQAMTHGKENPGLKVITDSIDRDLKAQQVNLEKKGQAINMLGVFYKNAQQLGMDEYQAKSVAKGMALSQVADQIEALSARTNSSLAKQNGQEQALRLRAEADKLMMDATKKESTTRSQTVQTPISKLLPQQKLVPEIQQKLISMENDDRNFKEINDMYELATAKSLTGPLQGRLQKFLNDHPGLAGADSAKLQQAVQNEMMQKAHQMFGARITEPEVQQLIKLIPDIRDKPEVFREKLNFLWRKNAEEYNGTLKHFPYQHDFTPTTLIYNRLNPSDTTFQSNK
jgi:hypothetical protein